MLLLPYFVKHARIRVFSDLHSCVLGKNRRFCPYKGKYRLKKTRILAILRSGKKD